jgi:glyoxylase-like metal-dependent hydrolase (beta-lactamase superfamily II)
MPNYICLTCGVQYSESDAPPAHCLICEDDRQYVRQTGQQWTTIDALKKDHHNRIEDIEPKLTGLSTDPGFAIGQRSLLVQTPQGNVLWDPTSLLDDATIEAVRVRGGVQAIAVSHPHLVGSIVDWSKAFGNAPIYWHAANREWVMRQDRAFVFGEEDSRQIWDGITLIRCGGHFPGSTVLHWRDGADGRGAVLTGDTITVAQDRRWVSFMYSYPNIIPLNARAIEQIVKAVEPHQFDRIYGGWWDSIVASDAKAAVKRSADRYIKAIAAD